MLELPGCEKIKHRGCVVASSELGKHLEVQGIRRYSDDTHV